MTYHQTEPGDYRAVGVDLRVTARPDAPELSAAEQRFLDRPDAPESLRERVALELAAHEPQHHSGHLTGEPDWFSCGPADTNAHPCGWASDPESGDVARDHRLHVAGAVLAVVRGETS